MDKRYQHLYNQGDRNQRRKQLKANNKAHGKTHSKTHKDVHENHGKNLSAVAAEKPEKGMVLSKKHRILAVLASGTLLIFVMVVVIGTFIHLLKKNVHEKTETIPEPEVIEVPALVGVAERFPELPITEDFLTINEYSRPGLALSSNPQYIVIHYTANPGSTAKQNRDYFENLKDTHQTYASAQFVIGLQGEIEQCVPCNEIAYCSNSLNDVCISIELCHPDEEGNFNDATYNNCVYLVAQLMNYYHLDMDHLIRHYDVTGKNCPKYFVEHPDRWEVFKNFVEEYREKFREEAEEGARGE